MRRFRASVADIVLESRVGLAGKWRLTLDPPGFAPGETGVLEAVTRSGTRLVIPVLEVTRQDEVVWCVVEKPLAAGTDVEGCAS